MQALSNDIYVKYKEVINEIDNLEKERRAIVDNYIHELEQKKIQKLRTTLGANQKII